MFTEMIRLLYSSMNLPKLLQDYTLVFEPSWSGYCSPDFLRFTQFTEEIFVLSAEENDFAFLQRLGSNLIPIGLGPCDWVDPRVATPYLANPKEFDIVMNSNWAAWKRHHVLFRMLARADQRYKVVLIGGGWGGKTSSDIETLADFYGVREQLMILERLPYEKVMDVTCRSKVSILLSLKEGSNRAIAESLFCNVPVVVLSSHVGGIRKNIVPQTGVLTEERHLESAINRLLSSDIRPRDWAMENVSCFKSSDKLNALLREQSLQRRRPWTQGIAGRSNSPESKYICDADEEHLRPWNQGLKNYLRSA
jgi:glycosyltransferase involved in cell wall biosynthesis